MKTTNHHLRRLLKSAGPGPGHVPAEAPFALEIRALDEWQILVTPNGEPFLTPLFRWASVCACLMILLSLAMNYRLLRDAGPNVLSMADSAIKMSMLP